jgi:hypothetical protein
MRFPVNDTINDLLNDKLNKLEEFLVADVISFYGPIVDRFAAYIKPMIQEIALEKKHDTLYFKNLTCTVDVNSL